jgi:cyclopropane fatty-acyl-phospholipid synthase-like methyltransferase
MSLTIFIIACITWILGVSYLCWELYYRLAKKEVFVPFVPSDVAGVESMCEAVKLTGNERVIDIGSGWGTIVFFLAKRYQNLTIAGVELHPLLHVFALLWKAIKYRKSNITLYRKDAALLNYSSYDVIFVFMLSDFLNKVLAPKLEKELKPGAKVVSYVFAMKSTAFDVEELSIPAHGWRSKVYVYTKR